MSALRLAKTGWRIADKLVMGMPEEFLKAATDRLARINHAYDLLSRQRTASSKPV